MGMVMHFVCVFFSQIFILNIEQLVFVVVGFRYVMMIAKMYHINVKVVDKKLAIMIKNVVVA